MCCGKRREELSSYPVAKVPPSSSRQSAADVRSHRAQAAPAVQPQAPGAPVPVRYTETQSIVVRGPITGRRYAFSGANPVQSIDARDAAAILQARFFRRA
jgi:hypothetical protein